MCDSERPDVRASASVQELMTTQMPCLQYRQYLQVQASMLGHMHRRHSVPERPAMACITCDTAVLKG